MTATSLRRASTASDRARGRNPGLSKSFGRTKALDGLDLTVAPGEITGFLGPNGAGKSTTIRVLLGLLRADSGTVRLLGGDPWRDAVALHRRIAYVPGDVTLWPNLTGLQAIDFLGGLRGNGDRHPAPGPADRAVRTRPAQEGADILQGQPAEGGDRRRVLDQCRALHSRRADVGPGPVDGEGVSALCRGGVRPRRGGVVVQPHPGRGREALRQRHDHPRRPCGRSPVRSTSCDT